jgi:hypothetical protein
MTSITVTTAREELAEIINRATYRPQHETTVPLIQMRQEPRIALS